VPRLGVPSSWGITMKLCRRNFLHLAAGAAAFLITPRIASALGYPARPVHIIVGFPPASGPDLVARLVGQRLSERLGQQFIVEDRPGAGSSIATQTVVNAPADGYTLLLATSANAINATLYPNLHFNFLRDVVPIASINRAPFVMVVNPAVPAPAIPEFIAYAKANPHKVNMASAGIGSTVHLCYELFKMTTGLDLVHVPYRASYLPDLIGGQVQGAFSSVPQAIQYIRDGKLRALAVTSTARVDVLPDVPSMGEFVPGYDAEGWFGIAAPNATPIEIINKLNGEINAVVADPKTKAQLVELGAPPMSMTPAEFGKLIADQTEKWAKVIKFADIKPE
jgi:tripartite-type tricarboxylate transporter receptor subunit TctC